MKIGEIKGRITTKYFYFDAEARVKKLDYVSVKDPEGNWVLAIVDSVVADVAGNRARAKVIGFRDSRGFLTTPKIPFKPGTPIYTAEKDFIKKTLGIAESGVYVGLLEGYDIKVCLDTEFLIKKHIAILAKTGAGKSYLAGVLLEEFAENDVPVVVIDPHGEYSTLRKSNENPDEIKFMERFDIKPKSYKDKVVVFGIGKGKELKLDTKLSAEEIIRMLPVKISPSQKGLLYSAIKNLEGKDYTLRDVIDEISASKSPNKWNLLSALEILLNTKLFSANPTLPKDLVKKGKISIINLREARPEIQQMIVAKLAEDLFTARKHGKIPPFLFVLEEAHNFCPERGFGETASSRIIRTIASEGRKFGMGLMVITQRPARIDKNVLSQCNTQLILKVTNPHDLKAITESVEGVTPGLKEEIKDLPVGVALVVGATEQPLLVDVRVRRTQHGGESIITDYSELVPEEKQLIFTTKIDENEIRTRFKGADTRLVGYPLWLIYGKLDATHINVCIDGITGEILFHKESSTERTYGMRKLMELPPSARLIILYLKKHRFATSEKLAEDLKIPVTTVKNTLMELMRSGYISTDGFVFKNELNLLLPDSVNVLNIKEKPVEGIYESTLDFMVTSDFAKRAAELLGVSVDKVEAVYYPYWIVEHKGKKLLVDGVTGKIDIELSDTVRSYL